MDELQLIQSKIYELQVRKKNEEKSRNPIGFR